MRLEDRIVTRDGTRYRLVIIDNTYIYSTWLNSKSKRYSLGFMYNLYVSCPYKFINSEHKRYLLYESDFKTLTVGYL